MAAAHPWQPLITTFQDSLLLEYSRQKKALIVFDGIGLVVCWRHSGAPGWLPLSPVLASPLTRVHVRNENSTRDDLGCRGIPCKERGGHGVVSTRVGASHGWSWRQRWCQNRKTSKFFVRLNSTNSTNSTQPDPNQCHAVLGQQTRRARSVNSQPASQPLYGRVAVGCRAKQHIASTSGLQAGGNQQAKPLPISCGVQRGNQLGRIAR